MAVPQDEIDNARIELRNLISPGKFSAPDLLRLAYAAQFTIAHFSNDDAGTTTSTDAAPKTTQSANNNNNLKDAIAYASQDDDAGTTASTGAAPKTTQSAKINDLKNEIKKIKEKNDFKLTYPDLYQLAGSVAVEVLGDLTIPIVPGRKDLSISPDERYLPDVFKQSPPALRDAFKKVRIYETNHIVALCGGLNLASGAEDRKLDNKYFEDLNKKQSSSQAGSNALLDDPDFYKWVQLYATNKGDFIKHYEEAHKKLSEFGLPYSGVIRSAMAKSTSFVNVGQKEKAFGVAVAAIVVILSVFYLINRRRAKHSPQQFQ